MVGLVSSDRRVLRELERDGVELLDAGVGGGATDIAKTLGSLVAGSVV